MADVKNWRYQAVWREEANGDRYYTICEIFLGSFGHLTNWTQSAEHTPLGNDIEDLLGELAYMAADAARWQPVAFHSLRVGMTFKNRQIPGMSEIVEKGRWCADNELGKPENVWIESSDITHDVRLHVSGDFADWAQKLAYAEEIARRLNRATAAPEMTE